MRNKLTQKELAEKIGADEKKVSKIWRHRIKEFSTDQLICLLYKLDSNLSL